MREQVWKLLVPAWGTMDSREHVFGVLDDVWCYDRKRWVSQTIEAEREKHEHRQGGEIIWHLLGISQELVAY